MRWLLPIPRRALWLLSGAWLLAWLHGWLWRRRYGVGHLYVAGLLGMCAGYGLTGVEIPACTGEIPNRQPRALVRAEEKQ